MKGPRWTTPAEISEDGNRIVVETNYATGDRCQLIFQRRPDRSGWDMSLCAKGCPQVALTTEQTAVIAYGLRQPGKVDQP